MNLLDLNLNLINWNIGGAKYLNLPPNDGTWKQPKRFTKMIKEPCCREEYQWRLTEALKMLLDSEPHIVTMQEVVQYEENGNAHEPEDILNMEYFNKEGYDYRFHFFYYLIL